MPDPIAKIIDVDVSKINNTDVDFSKRKAAEMSIIVEIEHNGMKYNRKFTFVSHDEYIHHIAGPITKQDVEAAILREVDTIKSMHDVAIIHSGKKNVDLVAEVRKKNKG